MARGRAWSEAERETLTAGRRAVPPVSWDELSRQLGRTPVACAREAARLGLLPPSTRPPVLREVRQRPCLTCRESFEPEHRTNFVCAGCKLTLAWRWAS